jgi:NAD(P)-dependent dehydrogenase (short-subunit alcohol dehydrogenase family)
VSGLLEGRATLVTGAASGIGEAIARTLAAEGARVAGVDVQPGGGGHTVVDLQADLAEVAALPQVVRDAEAAVGPLDVLVNCAGINVAAPALELELELLERILRVNLTAPVLLAQAAARGMVERGYGRIVNITSVHGGRGAAHCLAYDASKAALDNATRTLAVELAEHGVLVNAVAPGFVRTPMCHDGILAQDWYQDVYLRYGRVPQRRPGVPDDVAAPVAWLASERNTHVTGQILGADGGLTATF